MLFSNPGEEVGPPGDGVPGDVGVPPGHVHVGGRARRQVRPGVGLLVLDSLVGIQGLVASSMVSM